MNTLKIAFIAGIRAQFVKLASLQATIQDWNLTAEDTISPIYINAGQHYSESLSTSFVRELGIHFDIDLTPFHVDRRPITILSSMIVELYRTLREVDQLRWAVVFGDANTTLAGAIAAAKAGVPLIHVEAGVRVGNIFRQEEQNRVIADHLASLRFATSHVDMQNLSYEGLGQNSFWIGDLVYDLVLRLIPQLPDTFENYVTGNYVVATLHREENLASDNILYSFVTALNNHQRPVIFFLHPRTSQRLEDLGLMGIPNFDYRSGGSYLEMLSAVKNCAYLVTDSGALQRESFYLKKRCLVRQNEPFWHSLVKHGAHLQVGSNLDELMTGFDWMEQLILKPYPVIDDLGNGTAGLQFIQQVTHLNRLQQSNA